MPEPGRSIHDDKNVSFGIGSFRIQVPSWLFRGAARRVLLWTVILIAACLSVFNFVQARNNKSSTASLEQRNRTDPGFVTFSKTFLFWTPAFEHGTDLETNFHNKLNEIFGGWTRISVDGSSGNQTEKGYLYLVSLPNEKKDISIDGIRRMLERFFYNQTDHYVVEFNHQQP